MAGYDHIEKEYEIVTDHTLWLQVIDQCELIAALLLRH